MLMKTIVTICLAIFCLNADAQFRYNLYTLAGGTNSTAAIGTNAAVTYNASVDVGGSTRAGIQFYFKLRGVGTNLVAATETNPVVLRFDFSMDRYYFTNRFSWTNYANGSNEVFCLLTNVTIQDFAWLRLVDATNWNGSGIVTNFAVKSGNKIGL